MVSISTWCKYIANKFEYSKHAAWMLYKNGRITESEVGYTAGRILIQSKITMLDWKKGEEMTPTISSGGTLLVRKIPIPGPSRVFVGDIVLMRDPETHCRLVRRLAAIEGYEMASKDEQEEPFVLGKDECWVLADNEALKPKEAKDSRTFGPVHMSNILGRVIYCLCDAVDHGPVQNSPSSIEKDSPVLEVELDIDEMTKFYKG